MPLMNIELNTGFDNTAIFAGDILMTMRILGTNKTAMVGRSSYSLDGCPCYNDKKLASWYQVFSGLKGQHSKDRLIRYYH